MKIKTKFVIKTYTAHAEVRQYQKDVYLPFGRNRGLQRTAYDVVDSRRDTGYADIYRTEMEPKQIKVGEKFFIEKTLIPSLNGKAFTIHDVWEQEESQIFVVGGDFCTNVVDYENEQREAMVKADQMDRPLRLAFQEKVETMKKQYEAECAAMQSMQTETKPVGHFKSVRISDWEERGEMLTSYSNFVSLFRFFGGLICVILTALLVFGPKVPETMTMVLLADVTMLVLILMSFFDLS